MTGGVKNQEEEEMIKWITNKKFENLVLLFLLFVILIWTLPAVARESLVETSATITTLRREDIEKLPVTTVPDLMKLLPGVTPKGDQYSIRGGSAFDGMYMVDNMVITDPSQTDQFGSLSLGAFQEIQVYEGGLPAVYGNNTGGVINIVTRSGGNQFGGSVFGHYSPDYSRKGFEEGVETGGPALDYESGFTLGGPIIKDKLWFFGSMSMIKRTTQSPYAGESPQHYTDYYPFIKFDAWANEDLRFGLEYLFSQTGFDERQSYTGYQWEQEDVKPRHMISGSWNWHFRKGWYFNGLASYSHFSRDYKDIIPSYEYAPDSFYWYDFNKKKTTDRFQTRLDITTPPLPCRLWSHQLDFGAEFGHTRFSKKVSETDQHSTVVQHPTYQDWTYYDRATILDQRSQLTYLGFYVQDTWTLSDHFWLDLGLRFDYLSYNWPAQSSGGHEADPLDYDWTTISPRLGFTYDINGDGKTIAKLSWANYNQLQEMGWFEGAHPLGIYGWTRTQVVQDGTTITDDRTDYYQDPLSRIGYPGFDLQFPYVNEIYAGFEWKLRPDWSLGLKYFHKEYKDMIYQVDGSRLDVDDLMNNGVYNWIDFDDLTVTIPTTGQDFTVYQDLDPTRTQMFYILNPPDATRKYDGFQVELNKRYSDGWQLGLSYCWNRNQGSIDLYDYYDVFGLANKYSDRNAHINMDGLLYFPQPHQLKCFGFVDGPWGFSLGGFLQVMSGSPDTPSLSTDYSPVDGLAGSQDIIFTDERGSDKSLPTHAILDLRLKKEVKLGDFKLDFYLDCFNVLNNNNAFDINTIQNSPDEGETEEVITPRIFRLGAKIEW